MRKTGIYVYQDINNFLEQMEYLNREYHEINHYYKFIVDIKEMKNQLNYIKRKNVLCSSGYYTKNTIKLTIEDKRQKYCIEYKFKSRYVYKQFKREMRKMQI